jgi:hypothetical protein
MPDTHEPRLPCQLRQGPVSEIAEMEERAAGKTEEAIGDVYKVGEAYQQQCNGARWL